MDEKKWLQHCATEAQLRQFNDEGYLIVEDALSPDLLARLNDAVDRVEAREREEKGLKPDALLKKFRTVVEDDVFLELLDNPKTFPLLWDILGWNIQLYISHLIVYPPEQKKDKIHQGGWHQDGGRPVPEMERPHPRLSLKISYWLSDVNTPEHGAMQIVPRSHKLDTKPEGSDAGEGVLPVCVKAGTAVLFDRRMWHRRGINTSDVTRRVLFFGYSYRWLRGLDYNLMPENILSKCDPIRRQLLGDGIDVKGWWQPTEADVPLKSWLREHKGEDYLEALG
ncbi:MAG: phytanoyl-CoA dioxygenase family protein [Gemmatimonadota bacterium]|nr:phytanoyl-CoA dioxygenase family protein [Gemmatimonadota bacterium]